MRRLSAPMVIQTVRSGKRVVAMLLHISPKHHGGSGHHDKPEGIISWLLQKACNIIKSFVHKVEDEIEADVFNAALHEVVKLIHEEMKRVHSAGGEAILKNMLNRFMKAALLVQSILYGVAKDNVLQDGFEVLDIYDWSEWLYDSAVAVGEKFPEWGDPKARAPVRRLRPVYCLWPIKGISSGK